jgi:hypothetical protein
MNFTIEDVKKFILEFTELEYQVSITSFDSSVSEEDWRDTVAKLYNCYSPSMGFYRTSNRSVRSKTSMTEENLANVKRNHKVRRLFLIRKYENPVFGEGIHNTDSKAVFSCFLGGDMDMGAEVYPSNVSVGIVNGELRIITERDLNSEKRRSKEIIEWIYDKNSNEYLEGVIIEQNQDGKLVETLRVFEPEHPTWLADYNS